jgi:capsular polysaccharide biosynthesis protein
MDQHDFNRLKRYTYIFARGIFGAAAVFILTYMGITYVIDHLFTVSYRATAQIEIQPRPNADGSAPAAFDADQMRAEMEILMSPTTLAPVVDQLALVKSWSHRIFGLQQGDISKDEAVAHLQGILRVAVIRGTNIFAITTSSDVPQEAADIANAVADRYQFQRETDESARKERAKQAFQQEIDLQQQVVAAKEDTLEKIRADLLRKGISVSHTGTDPEDIDLQAYRSARRDLDRQRALLDAFVQHLRQVSDEFQLEESPVRIVKRAAAPPIQGRPNEKVEQIVAILIAAFLGVSVASSMEILLLLARASERLENY